MPKIHLQKVHLKDKQLRHLLDRDQVIYIEDTYDAEVNSYIQEHYSEICGILSSAHCKFCYLPYISQEVVKPDVVRYFTPYVAEMPQPTFGSSDLLPFIDGEISGPSLLFSSQDYYEEYLLVLPLDSADDSLLFTFRSLAKQVKKEIEYEAGHIMCSITTTMADIDLDNPSENADRSFPYEVERLMQEVKDKIEQLRQHGVNEMVLNSLLKPQLKLSPLHITYNGRIILPGYNNLEIKMTPLVKAVYLLFLRHPEGIFFKQLPDYREELYKIYSHLTGRISTEAIRQSVEDVTNPCKNSINEKCARIREAFVREFDDRLAKYYYVTGDWSLPKRIKLSRELVSWE